MQFVDVTNDIAFRKIFGNETKKKALISFLNAVIVLPGNERVVDVAIADPFQLGIVDLGKNTILDVKAIDNNGNHYLVEMQVAKHDYFQKRILYYTAQSYVGQIGKGEDYKALKPVYFIGILKFGLSQNPDYRSKHKVLDVATHEHLIQDLEFNLIELPKFSKGMGQLDTILDQWTYFIKHAEDLTLIPENIVDEGLLEAFNEANKRNWTQKEYEDYDKASMKEGDDRNRLEYAKKEKALEIAKSLKQNGVPVDIIALSTGLAQEDIADL